MGQHARSFRWHLAVFGFLVVAPVILAGAVISAVYVSSERANTTRRALDAARELRHAVDRQLEGGIAALKTLALSAYLHPLDAGKFHVQAAAAAANFPGSVIALRRADGQQLINTAAPPGDALPRTLDPILRAADAQALKSGQPVVSNLYAGTLTKRLYVVVQIPIELAGGPHLLSLAFPPETIRQALIGSDSLPTEWLLVAVDQNHRIIARSREHAKLVGSRATDDFIAKLSGAEGTFTSTTLDGEEVIDGFSRSALSQWTIIVAAPISSLAKPVHRAGLVVGLVAALGIVSSIVFATLYSVYFNRRIRRLRDQAEALKGLSPLQPFQSGVSELDSVSIALAGASTSLKTLVNELNHRVKNSLASVQSIAHQTLARNKDPAAFREAFTGRLIALSKAHDMLSEGSWRAADLHSLVQSVCGHIDGGGRLSYGGPSVALSPRTALSLGLVLHELCTNACKHGALAGPSGTVRLTWSMSPGGERLRLRWKETGGPPVAPPAQLGFGTRFMTASIEHELRGAVASRFEQDGALFEAEIPLQDAGAA